MLELVITKSYFSFSVPVGGVTIPPEACCTTTVAEVMSSGRSSPTSSLFASSVRRTVTLKVECQSYSRTSSGSSVFSMV